MKKQIKILYLTTLFLLTNIGFAQVIFTETMGNVTSNTPISTHEAANGFDNDAFTMTGDASVRNTQPSTGYSGASGGANIFINEIPDQYFEISGIDVSSYQHLQLSFGIFTPASGGVGGLSLEISFDGQNYYQPFFNIPYGTNEWTKITVNDIPLFGSIMSIRFRQTGNVSKFRIDDIVLEAVPCVAEIFPSYNFAMCSGGEFQLFAFHFGDYEFLWSTGETTQDIFVNTTGNYSVRVLDSTDCWAQSDSIHIMFYPEIIVHASASEDTICPGDSVTLTARIFTDDIFISEYVEGTGKERYLEIFNGTGAPVDLSNYRYQGFLNGSSTPTQDVALSGILNDGDVIVLKNPNALLYPGGVSLSQIKHNGDDAIALYNTLTGEYADIFGVPGQDPGSSWQEGGLNTKNRTLRRWPFIWSGIKVNPNMPGFSGFVSLSMGEWDLYNQDDVSDLGSHSLSCFYSWSGSTSPSEGCSVQAAPGSTETFTVTGSFFNGCSASAEVTVVVDEFCAMERSTSVILNDEVNNVTVYPNPFSENTTIQFYLTQAEKVSVDIMDINGKYIYSLWNGNMNEGEQRLNWNGKDAFGNHVTTGLYIVRISSPSVLSTVRLIVQ